MQTGLITAAYISASILFILSLGGLSNQEKAKRAIWYGIIGMILAVVATLFSLKVASLTVLGPMIIVGAIIGTIVARRVEMTGMPQLVAALHSFVGLAAVFIGINSELDPPQGLSSAEATIHQVEVFLGVFIGAITFTGSIVAYGKLAGSISSKALALPSKHLLNLLMVGVCLVLGALFFSHA
jgi:NAD(P) transhydrogenase subunit beta